MDRSPAVSRPAWLMALSGSGSGRRSPVEIVANAASYVTRTQAADGRGCGRRLGRWTDGVATLRGDCATFASHWQAHNDRVRAESGPLWVVLGDSTAQGLGALSPEGGYVGQVLAELRLRTGQPWRVLNLSTSGRPHPRCARRPAAPAARRARPGHLRDRGQRHLLLRAGPAAARPARADRHAPEGTVLLDLPLPAGLWGLIGRVCLPYVTRINRTIYAEARARGLPVAAVSAHFLPPWPGKFASDSSIPARPATATGRGRCWPRCRQRLAGGFPRPPGKDSPLIPLPSRQSPVRVQLGHGANGQGLTDEGRGPSSGTSSAYVDNSVSVSIC